MQTVSAAKLLLCAGALLAGAARADVVATFDDLSSPPPLTGASGLQYTNNNSLLYDGVTWDARFTVVGDQYSVSTGAPLFGIPHSGDYYVSNQDGADGLTITTNKLLTGAWFGRNQYYGYSEGGSDQVTIVALSGSTALGQVVFNLPESHPGQPEPLSFVDTSSFAALNGITGYRIDRHEVGEETGNWVADDFQFTNAVSAVPEPATLPMLVGGLGIIALYRRRQRRA